MNVLVIEVYSYSKSNNNLPRGSKSTELRLESSLWSCKAGRGWAARDVTSGLDSPDPPAERTDTALADDDAIDDFDRPLWKVR